MKAFPRDIEVTTLVERHIGVESELFVNSNEFQEVPADVSRSLKKHGLFQNVGYDGGGREFRTNPISIRSLYQVRGKKYLMEYFQSLKPVTEVVSSGGTHIHISILNKDHENMESNATALGLAFYEQFQKIAGRNTTWAGKFHQGKLKTIEQVKKAIKEASYSNSSRENPEPRAYYLKGSILNPTGHKTLEFRGPKGSNDAEEILAWVDFLQTVVKVANRKSIDGVKFSQLVSGDRIAEYISKLPKGRKLTKADLNKTVNVTALV